MSKYLYTHEDLALFFHFSDFTISDEKAIRDEIWELRNSCLEVKFRKNKYSFIKAIHNSSINLDDCSELSSDIQFINRVLEEIGSSYSIPLDEATFNDEYYIEAFFRLIKLRLTYTEGCDYIRFKLRTLLKEFGYKRRTSQLVSNINRTLKALNLESYLRNYEKCDISDVKLDDMIMIRLK